MLNDPTVGRTVEPGIRPVELVCPRHAEVLSSIDSSLECPRGCVFPVVNGIPRFVDDGYASGFGLQWKRYPRTQLDSYTGLPISRERLERCLGAPLETMSDKSVLEVGSGAGRFTELLIPNFKAVVSADISAAVEANLQNCRHLGDYLLLQGDVRSLPVRPRAFDVVLCLGVVQHTPSTEETIRYLARYVKPGGALVIDHYVRLPGVRGLAQSISATSLLRPLVKRLPRAQALWTARTLSRLFDPIQFRLSRHPKLDRLLSGLIPAATVYRRFPELSRELAREWNELNTHDRLTDWYKHRRRPAELREYLEGMGFVNVETRRGGNGVEVRAEVPA